MSTAYESDGRTGQKLRTREALVRAAARIIAAGATPTIDEAASAASISRSTAYRYFPSQRALLAAAHPETETASLLPSDAPEGDAAARLDLAVTAFIRLIVDTETQQRTMLRLSLEDGAAGSELPLRKGRAIRWFTEALEPDRARLGDEGLRRLVLAVRVTTGIEALTWLTDMGGLDREEAAELMRWSALALHRAATT